MNIVEARASRRPRASRGSRVFALWGVGGVALTFLECILRLGHRAATLLAGGLGTIPSTQWATLLAIVVAFGYGEGYLVLYKRFAPRVVDRAFARTNPSGLVIGLAPLYVLDLVGSDRRATARAWLGVALIVAAALSVRALPSPWRESVDAGVALALLLGLSSMATRSLSRVWPSRVEDGRLTEPASVSAATAGDAERGEHVTRR